MHSNSVGRSSSAGRISMFEREDRNLLRNEQRKTQTLKPRGNGESSHIPRLRFRSSSSDRAGSLGRISHLKIQGKHLPTTPITPARSSRPNLLSLGLTASSSKSHMSTCRSPSADGASFLGNKGPKKDRRTLVDKAYQAELLSKIDNFFYVNECSGMLNNGSLKSVTLKMFVEVSSFLLKFFDIKQELTMANYIEELPRCAKKLHYPGMMNKSWLRTANTMHSWPYVLGWIGWLVEACQVQEIAFEKYQLETLPFVGLSEEQMESSRKEFLTFLDCYNAWTEEDLNEENEILERYFKNILIQQGITQEDIAQAQGKLEDETLILQVIQKESQELDEESKQLQKELSLLDAKETKLVNDIKSKESHMKEITRETSLLNAEHDTLSEQIRLGNFKREELISTVKSQPMSRTEKEILLQKCTELQNYVHEFDEHLNGYKKELYNLDIKLAFTSNNLNKAILKYNKEVFMLVDTDAEVNFDELKLPEKSLLDPQILTVLEEKVALAKTFREVLAKRCNEMESVIRSNTTKIEKLEENINSLPSDDKLKEERSRIDQMKIDAKKEKEKMTKQIEDVKTDINKIQDMMPDIKAIDLEIEEAKDKLDAVIRRKAFLQQNAVEFFGELYAIIGEHRKELHDILTKYKK